MCYCAEVCVWGVGCGGVRRCVWGRFVCGEVGVGRWV